MKQHITDEGPKDCSAKTPESCRAKRADGSKPQHFDNPQEAEKAWQQELQDEYGNVSTLTKGYKEARSERFMETKETQGRVVEHAVEHPEGKITKEERRKAIYRAEALHDVAEIDLHRAKMLPMRGGYRLLSSNGREEMNLMHHYAEAGQGGTYDASNGVVRLAKGETPEQYLQGLRDFQQEARSERFMETKETQGRVVEHAVVATESVPQHSGPED